MTDLWHRPWPWYVTGPLVGLIAVSLLAIGSKQLGVSSNLRHLCAMLAPGKVSYFGYDWRREGLWNLVFILGPHPVAITPAAVTSLAKLGIRDFSGLVPHELFTWHMLLTPRGLIMFVGGGFLIGFGTAYAGGCTSGHGITGLAGLQLASLVTVIAFFAAGAAASFVVLPLLVPR
ncbi:MAG: YeeE/YedE family protein [Gemmatimonadetes bacterium]|nr:MAG: YeeE/YedE family protein [Gemmatimonadota bacterium]